MDWSNYTGIPWKEHGRDRDGIDCWGIIWLFYKEQLGIDIPNFQSDEPRTVRQISGILQNGKTEWDLITQHSRPGDANMYFDNFGHHGKLATHVGVIAPGNRLLHISANMSFSGIQRLSDPWLAAKKPETYRWRVAA